MKKVVVQILNCPGIPARPASGYPKEIKKRIGFSQTSLHWAKALLGIHCKPQAEAYGN